MIYLSSNVLYLYFIEDAEGEEEEKAKEENEEETGSYQSYHQLISKFYVLEETKADEDEEKPAGKSNI